MVDLDKFICYLLREDGYRSITTEDIFLALKQQGLEYKEGAIVPIESKPTLSSIFKGEWYICIKPVNYFTVGKIYYAIKDWVLSGDLGDTVDVRWTPDCFRTATKEDIEKQITRLNPSTIEMLEKPSTIKFDEPELSEFENKLGEIIIPTWEITKECEECKGDVEDIKKWAKELLKIAYRQFIKEETNMKKN